MVIFNELPTLPMPKFDLLGASRSLPYTLKGLSDWPNTWDGLLPPYRFLLKGIIEREWQEIANKILAGKKLTKMEKEATYFLLTGEVPPSTKKGRPSKADEHYNLAIEYLSACSKGVRGSGLKRLREELVKKYCNTETYQESTFYSAFKRGREGIRVLANHFISRVKEIEVLDDKVLDDNIKIAVQVANQFISEIDRHENKNKPLQKNRK